MSDDEQQAQQAQQAQAQRHRDRWASRNLGSVSRPRQNTIYDANQSRRQIRALHSAASDGQKNNVRQRRAASDQPRPPKSLVSRQPKLHKVPTSPATFAAEIPRSESGMRRFLAGQGTSTRSLRSPSASPGVSPSASPSGTGRRLEGRGAHTSPSLSPREFIMRGNRPGELELDSAVQPGRPLQSGGRSATSHRSSVLGAAQQSMSNLTGLGGEPSMSSSVMDSRYEPVSMSAWGDEQAPYMRQVSENAMERNYLLHVQVVEAFNLEGHDSDGLSDPYCKIKLGGAKLRTKTIAKSVNPVWDQNFTFPVFNFEEDLVISVWDRDRYTRDTHLGRVRVELSALLTAPNKQSHAWFPLMDKQLMRKQRGALNVKLCLRETYPQQDKVLRLLSKHPQLVAQQQANALGFQALYDSGLPISVGVGTWNMDRGAPPNNLSDWLGDTGSMPLPAGGYDLLAVGLQDCKYSTRRPYRSFKADWVGSLKAAIGSEYKLVAVASVGETRMAIFGHIRLATQVMDVDVASKSLSAKKGAVAIAFNVRHTSFCFVNMRLGDKDPPAQRNSDVREILSGLDIGKPAKLREVEPLDQYDHVLCMGDLGYRLDLNRAAAEASKVLAPGRKKTVRSPRNRKSPPPEDAEEEVDKLARQLTRQSLMNVAAIREDMNIDTVARIINKGAYSAVFDWDELSHEMRAGRVFADGWKESIYHGQGPAARDSAARNYVLKTGQARPSQPSFPPTSFCAHGEGIDYLPDECPAWSQRVLFRSRPGRESGLTLHSLFAAPSVASSVHKPIFALFTASTFTLAPSFDSRIGPSKLTFLQMAVADLRAESLKSVSPVIEFSAPMLQEGRVTSKVKENTTSPSWKDSEIPEAKLVPTMNNKARLKREMVLVTVRSGGTVLGRAFIPLLPLDAVDVLHDEVFERWMAHFRVNRKLYLNGAETGTLTGTVQIFWKELVAKEYKSKTSIKEAKRNAAERLKERRASLAAGVVDATGPGSPTNALKRGSVMQLIETVSGRAVDTNPQKRLVAALSVSTSHHHGRSNLARIAATAHAYRIQVASIDDISTISPTASGAGSTVSPQPLSQAQPPSPVSPRPSVYSSVSGGASKLRSLTTRPGAEDESSGAESRTTPRAFEPEVLQQRVGDVFGELVKQREMQIAQQLRRSHRRSRSMSLSAEEQVAVRWDERLASQFEARVKDMDAETLQGMQSMLSRLLGVVGKLVGEAEMSPTLAAIEAEEERLMVGEADAGAGAKAEAEEEAVEEEVSSDAGSDYETEEEDEDMLPPPPPPFPFPFQSRAEYEASKRSKTLDSAELSTALDRMMGRGKGGSVQRASTYSSTSGLGEDEEDEPPPPPPLVMSPSNESQSSMGSQELDELMLEKEQGVDEAVDEEVEEEEAPVVIAWLTSSVHVPGRRRGRRVKREIVDLEQRRAERRRRDRADPDRRSQREREYSEARRRMQHGRRGSETMKERGERRRERGGKRRGRGRGRGRGSGRGSGRSGSGSGSGSGGRRA